MDFTTVFRFLIAEFSRRKIDFALVGGFALQAAGVTRTTRDIDLVILSQASPVVKELMLSHGYTLAHESGDILNFIGKDFALGRVDFILAHREYAVTMLKRAKESPVLNGNFTVKVISPEDIIGLKVQACANDPARLRQDMADVEAVIRYNIKTLNMTLVREYFQLFEMTGTLEAILKGVDNA